MANSLNFKDGGTLLPNSFKLYLDPIRSFTVKDNHLRPAVSEILATYRKNARLVIFAKLLNNLKLRFARNVIYSALI